MRHFDLFSLSAADMSMGCDELAAGCPLAPPDIASSRSRLFRFCNLAGCRKLSSIIAKGLKSLPAQLYADCGRRSVANALPIGNHKKDVEVVG